MPSNRPASPSFRTRGLALGLAILPGLLAGSLAANPAPRTLLTEKDDFDRTSLMAPEHRSLSVSGLSFGNPNRFSMRQSYSVGYSSGSFGSYSSGLYLNTVSYRLADPLTLSADIGFHTPFYSSMGGPGFGNGSAPGLGSLVLPHVGLEYRPSENSTISLHLFNGPDAARAYGYPGASLWNPWYR